MSTSPKTVIKCDEEDWETVHPTDQPCSLYETLGLNCIQKCLQFTPDTILGVQPLHPLIANRTLKRMSRVSAQIDLEDIKDDIMLNESSLLPKRFDLDKFISPLSEAVLCAMGIGAICVEESDNDKCVVECSTKAVETREKKQVFKIEPVGSSELIHFPSTMNLPKNEELSLESSTVEREDMDTGANAALYVEKLPSLDVFDTEPDALTELIPGNPAPIPVVPSTLGSSGFAHAYDNGECLRLSCWYVSQLGWSS